MGDPGSQPVGLLIPFNRGSPERAGRGIFRFVRFPATDEGDLVVPWLWSDRRVVERHESALHAPDLADALPARVHLTLPAADAARRPRIPPNVAIAFTQALEARLRADATRLGRPIHRQRQLVVFDRFLARGTEALGERVVVKGGVVLELWLARARTTRVCPWRRALRSADRAA